MSGKVNTDLLKRAALVSTALLTAFVFLLGRVFFIQVFSFERYQNKVIEQMTTESPANAGRGKIYDTNGQILATNITNYRLFISPSAISSAQKRLDGKRTDSIACAISSALSEITGIDRQKIYDKTQKTSRLDETIQNKVDSETAEKIRRYIIENNMEGLVCLEATSERYYPFGSLASHVIGFTSTDGVGLYGLEYQYNEEISGEDGYYITARDSRGNEMPNQYQSYVEPVDGYDLTTTIDVYIQAVLEEQLENAVFASKALNRACGIVMDVKTGAILAMAVYPEFDLNDPWNLVDYYEEKLSSSGYAQGSTEYEALAREYMLEMWSNKALTETYIPGSTFKIVTSSMALEENLPIINNSVSCGGSKLVLGKTIHCHKRKGHGLLTFAEGIQNSCNVWFMTIGQALGVDRFTKYFNLFGYREKTGIDLPGEGLGVISSNMSELDLSIYAFGQNFTITAIQHIAAISAVANGGNLVTPYVVLQKTDSNGNVVYQRQTEIKRTVVQGDTSEILASILADGVSGEGGAKNAYVAGYRVAAKTGTSEKKGKTTTGTEMYVCSCAGFAPADDPQVAMIIMVDEPSSGLLYGSTVAAPYIGKAFESILPYIGVEPVYTDEEADRILNSIPSYVGLEAENAKAYAESKGLLVEMIGDGKYVCSQSPKSGSAYSGTSAKIVFYTDSAQDSKAITVPDVVGYSLAQANVLITNSGLNVKISGASSGSGNQVVVYSQSPAAGAQLSYGEVVNIEIRYTNETE